MCSQQPSLTTGADTRVNRVNLEGIEWSGCLRSSLTYRGDPE